ncbi:MAG TPA: alpha-amylase family glycosyl hydrolase [Candidatus Dormibacteraeota bacterium]|nr:alpha-amylase family glycosyl hydrolase [Candidatus Dormibacteraeota bacterium]
MTKTIKKNVGVILHRDGVTFRVWAPFANSVAVSGSFNNWTQSPLTSENDGYWSTDISNAQAGQEYKFVIGSGDKLLYKNDPRSLQVTTSAGNSIIVDPQFDWGEDNFKIPPKSAQIFYELHVGTFNRLDPSTSGNFETAAQKLDYLAELGITMIELMPIGTMAMDRGWGYATDYIYAVESLYGGRHQFLEFVKAAHKRGIGIVLDVVFNHFGPDGGLDLWQFDGWSQDGKGGIYFYNDWRSQTPWGETRPDYGRPEVAQYILDNVRMWMYHCHLDGLRLDSTIYIRNVMGNNNDPDHDIADGWNLMQRINNLARKIKPEAIMIAEDVSGNEYMTKPQAEGGAGFSAQWEVNFPHLLRNAIDALDDANRDLNSINSALLGQYNGDVFQRIIYCDSHDSAANGGARLSEEIAPGHVDSVFAARRSLIAASIVLTAPGIPMLLQGQEFMENGSFNDWQALDWQKSQKFAGIVLAYRHLIALRKNQYGHTAGLMGQSIKVLQLDQQPKVLVYHRWDQGGPGDDVVIAINFANQTLKDYNITFPRNGSWITRFNSDWKGYSPSFKDLKTPSLNVENNSGKINLGPYSVLVLSQDN